MALGCSKLSRPMKLQVTIDGEASLLDLESSDLESAFRLEGAIQAEGIASVSEITPGVFSVLLGHRSYRVYVEPGESGAFVLAAAGQSHVVSVIDQRDRSARSKKQITAGPMELRAQMPGKVVKLLVQPGSNVEAGESLIVVEAMKMQNEMKSPKDGVVRKIYVTEGATVSAGDRLMTVE